MATKLSMAEARTLKSGAYGVHIFPSRYSLIEPHVGVPLATIFQSKRWLAFWHGFGIGRRAGVKTDLDMVTQNAHYLASITHYRRKGEFDRHLRNYFLELHEIESMFLQHRLRNHSALRYLDRCQLVAWLYRTFRDRVIAVRKVI